MVIFAPRVSVFLLLNFVKNALEHDRQPALEFLDPLVVGT
jgi:hypothetical protein